MMRTKGCLIRKQPFSDRRLGQIPAFVNETVVEINRGLLGCYGPARLEDLGPLTFGGPNSVVHSVISLATIGTFKYGAPNSGQIQTVNPAFEFHGEDCEFAPKLIENRPDLSMIDLHS